MKSNVKGYIFAVIAAVSYGTNPLFGLPLLESGINADSVLFLRYLLAVPMLAAVMLFKGIGFGMRKNQILPVIILGIAMAVSSLTYYTSFLYIGAAVSSTLLFIYPVLVTLIMAIFFHEKTSLFTVLCILIALSGVGLLYKGDNGGTLNMVGLVLTFVSALSYAIYIVYVNGQSLRDMDSLKLTLYVLLSGIAFFSVKFDTGTFAVLNNHPLLWIDALAVALFPTAISLLATGAAIHHIGSTPVAIMGALEPVTAVFFAVTIFHEALTLRLATGMFLIVMAVTLIIAAPVFKRIKANKCNC